MEDPELLRAMIDDERDGESIGSSTPVNMRLHDLRRKLEKLNLRRRGKAVWRSQAMKTGASESATHSTKTPAAEMDAGRESP